MKIKQIAEKYKLSKDDFWELKRGTRSLWIITHDACEKIAAQENIQFGAPTIYRDSNTRCCNSRRCKTRQQDYLVNW